MLLPPFCCQVGSDGVLSIENSNTMETSVEVEEGMSIDRGYVSREMITNQVCTICLCGQLPPPASTYHTR